MEILILSNCPIVESQGSGYVITNTIRALESYGHNIKIIPPSLLIIFPSLNGIGHIYRMALGMAFWVLKNSKSLRKYHLIIVYGAESSLALFTIQKVLKINTPVILHSNGIEIHVDEQMSRNDKYIANKGKWYHINKSFLYNYCYKHATAIITVSKFDWDFVVNELKINKDAVFFNEPCLPEIYFSYDISKFTKRKIITYCGTWIDRKGIFVIKKSIPYILRKYPDYSLRLIGIGNDFKLEDHFPKDIIHNIELYPHVENQEQLLELYAESSIFLFPSLHESFGLVIPEAMYCGCAVISSSTGYGAAVKNDIEAIILKEPDILNVQNALEKLISDDSFRKTLSVNARKRTQILKWENYYEKLNQILSIVLKQSAW